jgi:Na+-translocating ferredoxin:NAD+ oxidoreductase RnfD subunit
VWPTVDRNTILWTLVVFFGATVMFGAIRNATEGESTAVSLGLQVIAGLVLVGVLVLVLRSRR